MHAPYRGPRERLAAWLVTGPLGHLWSAVADLAALVTRRLRDRAGIAGHRDRSA